MTANGNVTYNNEITDVAFDLFRIDELEIPLMAEPTTRPISELQIKSGWIRPVCCAVGETRMAKKLMRPAGSNT
jgi:hypothetical protein